MNEPRFGNGSRVRVRMNVDASTHPGKHPNVAVKGKVGVVKGYGGWNMSKSSHNHAEVNHEYVIGFDDGTVVVISESWLEAE